MTPYYDEDGITIYHGDCADVVPLVEPSTVALLVTDPPYGIRLSTSYGSAGRGVKGGLNKKWAAMPNDYPPVHGDDWPFEPEPLLRFPRLVLFGANNYANRLPPSSSWIVWNRQTTTDAADAELAWTNLGGTVRMFSHLWDGYRRSSEVGFHVHPTQKPVALFKWILNRWTQPGDLILDPYMGSGPIAQACHEMGRRYIGVEIVEEYCKVAVNRLAQGVLAL